VLPAVLIQRDSPSAVNLARLTKRYNWKTQEVSLIDLTAPNSKVKLNDPTVDGEVLVIPGGAGALPDAQVKFITDYLDKGGKLAIFAAPLNADGKPDIVVPDLTQLPPTPERWC
jgi:hypothetical protein